MHIILEVSHEIHFSYKCAILNDFAVSPSRCLGPKPARTAVRRQVPPRARGGVGGARARARGFEAGSAPATSGPAAEALAFQGPIKYISHISAHHSRSVPLDTLLIKVHIILEVSH